MPLSAAVAREVYDRVGRLEDTQRVYEDAATDRLAELAEFGQAASVFELGCGTGRYAARLLATRRPASATYLGADVSPRMVALATARLAPWHERAHAVRLDPPAADVPLEDGAVDRFVSTYVFDLLSGEHARALMGEAVRVLAPEGLLALVSLGHGTTRASRTVASLSTAVAERWPRLVAGCRPIDLRELVGDPRWSLERCEVVVRLAVPSQVLVARCRPDA
jgi:SAM-dependent methyltransferase